MLAISAQAIFDPPNCASIYPVLSTVVAKTFLLQGNLGDLTANRSALQRWHASSALNWQDSAISSGAKFDSICRLCFKSNLIEK